MVQAVVKEGCKYGAGGKHGPGTVVEVPEIALVAFRDKLQRLETPQGQGVKSATKAAVELASENGIDISTVEGTGSGGKVTLSDVKALVSEQE